MRKNASPKEKRVKKKVSLSFTLIAAGILVMIIFAQFISGTSNERNRSTATQYTSPSACSASMSQVRLTDYQFTRPLLLADVNNESDNLSELKVYFNFFIQQKKQQGILNSASVYVRKLGNGEWISVNGSDGFNPGSLVKVPVLICYLKQAEKNPALLEKQIFFAKSKTAVPNQTFAEKPIEAGRSYKIKELLYYMIVKSDNYATHLLNENMDIPAFKKLFTDLAMAEPDVHDLNFALSVSDYSKFMRVLYSATYLNAENSEYALSLLVQGDFKDGLLKQLPPDVKAAHKFGEFGRGAEKQLHEAAIVYSGDNTYLIIVMTKGSDVKRLPEVLSEISKYVYDFMGGSKINS